MLHDHENDSPKRSQADMPSSKVAMVALIASSLALIVTFVSLMVVLVVAANSGRGPQVSQKPTGAVSEPVGLPTGEIQSSPVAAQTQPAIGSSAQPTSVLAPPTIDAPKEIADYARALIEESKCKSCPCGDINIVRAARRSLTDAEKASQIADAWCVEIYYAKKVCQWEDMATTLSIRTVQGELQAAEMNWGEFDRCLMPSR